MKESRNILFCGAIIGLLSALLVKFGNPLNMGVCVACFLRDISGSLGLHRAAVVQFIRPEIIGIIMGAFLSAFIFKEFKSVGGSSPFIRFLLGIVVMIGALVFLGCPLRMVLRLGGGDLNAIIGLLGFFVGILIGIYFLQKGFSLRRNYKQNKIEGYFAPLFAIFLFVLLVLKPAFIFFSEKGPGAMYAPIGFSLAVGLLVGFLSQRTRLCMVGGLRDIVLFKDTYLIKGFVAIFVFVLIGNLAFSNFNLGFSNQPIAHTEGLWNFLGMVIVGWGSVLLGGCPLRQLILAGEGNSDSLITIMGLIVGGAIAHNFSLAASPKGVPDNSKVAVFIIIAILALISYFNIQRVKKGVNKSA